jgi:hypothetical protein
VWFAFIRYRNSSDGKHRPVVIFDDTGQTADVFPVYGLPSMNADYELQRWENAGLVKPSCVNLTPMLINTADFKHRLGRLNITDIRKIIKQINE